MWRRAGRDGDLGDAVDAPPPTEDADKVCLLTCFTREARPMSQSVQSSSKG